MPIQTKAPNSPAPEINYGHSSDVPEPLGHTFPCRTLPRLDELFSQHVAKVRAAVESERFPEVEGLSAVQHPLFLQLAVELLDSSPVNSIKPGLWTAHAFDRMVAYTEAPLKERDAKYQLGLVWNRDVEFLVDATLYASHTHLMAISAMVNDGDYNFLLAEKSAIRTTKEMALKKIDRL